MFSPNLFNTKIALIMFLFVLHAKLGGESEQDHIGTSIEVVLGVSN